MSKSKVNFICDRCGAESPQWHGKCRSCGEWNTLVEFRVPDGPPAAARRASAGAPVAAAEVDIGLQPRVACGVEELDRVLVTASAPKDGAKVAFVLYP